jgi:hypothetical protein
MEAVDVLVVGAGDLNVSSGGRSIFVKFSELSRSRVLSQMISGASSSKLSFRLPCGYLELWLAYIRHPLRSNTSISLDTSVKMLNVRRASWGSSLYAFVLS